MALVEGFRGDILVWVRIADGGVIERCHLRDPSWFQWPLLEAAIEGNIVADFPALQQIVQLLLFRARSVEGMLSCASFSSKA